MRSPYALVAVVSASIVSSPVGCNFGVESPVGCNSGSTEDAGAAPETCSVAPPPAEPDAGPPATTTRSAFAMTKLYLGATDRRGAASQSAWKYYGLNIDGKVTTRDSTDVCRLASGAARSTQADACSGIDNSFGQNILPMLMYIGQDVLQDAVGEERFNASIADGTLTNLVAIDGLEPTRDATGLRASLLFGGPRAADGASWAQRADAFASGGAPWIAFDRGFVNGGVFVAGPPSGPGHLTLGTDGGFRVIVDVTHVQLVATVSTDGASLTDGVISGIVPVAPFVEWVKRLAGRVSTSLCLGSAFDSIAQQIRQAADILVDGTQDPTRDCDGISFGIGFDARATTLGPIVATTAAADPCAPDGGLDAADGAADAALE